MLHWLLPDAPQAVVKILREADECKARMHWGKAGWEKWAPCFDGATEYPQTWCHFGCAVQASIAPASLPHSNTSASSLSLNTPDAVCMHLENF